MIKCSCGKNMLCSDHEGVWTIYKCPGCGKELWVKYNGQQKIG